MGKLFHIGNLYGTFLCGFIEKGIASDRTEFLPRRQSYGLSFQLRQKGRFERRRFREINRIRQAIERDNRKTEPNDWTIFGCRRDDIAETTNDNKNGEDNTF
jgi:hypothetical protein